jgi:small subunit ribosomal protein S21
VGLPGGLVQNAAKTGGNPVDIARQTGVHFYVSTYCGARSGSGLAGRWILGDFTFSRPYKGGNVVKLTVRDRESIQEAVRRFRKLVERSGIKKEMRRREYYEKPSEIRRRARLRAERRTRRVVKPVGA